MQKRNTNVEITECKIILKPLYLIIKQSHKVLIIKYLKYQNSKYFFFFVLKKVVTANCVPITGKNNFATNGIVQLTSGVLPQPTKSVGEIIQSDEQFTTIRKCK